MLKPLIISAAMLSVMASMGLVEINSGRGSVTRAEAKNIAIPNFIPSDQQA
jgi:hypothetical protein